MSIQTIGVGAADNDGTGDTARAAFGKANDNFADLYGVHGADVQTFTFTTKQDDLAVNASARFLRWTGAGTTGITGIAAPSTARILTIINAGTDYLLWLENRNTASAATNRFLLPDGFLACLMPGDTITIWYDLTSAVWRVLDWPTRGIQMGFSLYSDFLDYGGASSDIAGYANGTGAGSSSGYENSAYASGMRKIYTGTTTAGLSTIAGYQACMYKTAQRGGLVGAAVMVPTATDGTETYALEVGFTWGDTSSATHAACWEYRWNGAAAELSQTIISNGSASRSTSGSPSVTSPAITTRNFDLMVFINSAWTRVDFLYSTDGIAYTLAQSIAATFAAGSPRFSPAVAIKKSAGTTSRTAISDWFGVRLTGGVAR